MQIGSFSLIKELNTSIILNTIRNSQSISRAEIAKITGLTPATVTNITAELLSHKLIVETKLGKSSGGRKPVLLEFNARNYNLIGVCIGKSLVEITLANLNSEIIKRESLKLNLKLTPTECFNEISKHIKNLLDESQERVLGIGVSIEGLIDDKKGICVLSTNLGWENVNIKEILNRKFNMPIFIDNDVKAIALGEKWFGSVKDNKDFILLYVGFGIGAAIYTNGEIYRGISNYASELGHMTIDTNGPLCECGNKGCLQSLASESSLIKQVYENKYDKYFADEDINAINIINKALHGNKELYALIKKQAYYIGVGIANIINIFNPSLIIINGFICKAGNEINIEIQNQIKQRSLKNMQNSVNIVFSKLGDEALYKGAIALVASNVFKNPEAFFEVSQ